MTESETHAGRMDPIHAITPGTVREYRSRCCLAKFETEQVTEHWCNACGRPTEIVLTKVYP